QFMGEKFGRDNIWEGHLASELWTTQTEVRAVLDEQQAPLSKVLNLKVGDTLMLNVTPDSDISIRAGSIPLTTGKMGRKGQHIAVRVEEPINIEAAQRLSKGKR
ncbi:MAG: FliM/FliN family flagellar motor switch protein, partial [Pseudomonadota bacterium]